MLIIDKINKICYYLEYKSVQKKNINNKKPYIMKANKILFGWSIAAAVAAVFYLFCFLLGSGNLIAGIVCFVWLVIIFATNFKMIPSGQRWLIEYMRKYERTFEPGPQLLTPFFERVSYKASSREEIYRLFNDNDADKIDFTDTSAVVEMYFYLLFVDPVKAAYAVVYPIGAVTKLIEDRARTILSHMTVDEANEAKATLGEKILTKKFRNKVLREWGILLTKLVVADIKLSDADLEVRRSVLKKEKELEIKGKDLEIADIDQKIKEKEAIGKKHGLVKTGEGLADQLERLQEEGLSPLEAAEYLINHAKWSAIEKNDGTTIIDGSGTGGVSAGVTFGTGFRASHKKRPVKS